MSGLAVALIIGRKDSVGFPGKNTYLVLGRPLAYYPIQAAIDAVGEGNVFLSTDDRELMMLACSMGANVIKRPRALCTTEALGEDAFVHGYGEIKRQMPAGILALMFCNCPTVTKGIILQGVRILRKNRDIDSAVTVSRYNMWSPARARRIDSGGLLCPFVALDAMIGGENVNCDRDSQGDVWFADMGVSVVRSRCLENIRDGLPPQRWMGRKIYPLKQEGGLDVDYKWQIPMVEHWLRGHGHGSI